VLGKFRHDREGVLGQVLAGKALHDSGRAEGGGRGGRLAAVCYYF
jgi:hypothetical protein